jgi:hypothetical protein
MASELPAHARAEAIRQSEMHLERLERRLKRLEKRLLAYFRELIHVEFLSPLEGKTVTDEKRRAMHRDVKIYPKSPRAWCLALCQ